MILIGRNSSDLQKLDALKKEKKRRVEIGRMDTAARGTSEQEYSPQSPQEGPTGFVVAVARD